MKNMKKKTLMLPILLTILALIMVPLCAGGESAPDSSERAVETVTLDLLLPQEAPVYHLIYDYPYLTGEDSAAVLFNDVFDSMQREMENLMLPMLANLARPEDGEMCVMRQTFTVTCNDGNLLSVLFLKQNETGDGIYYSLEAQTYAMSGEFTGQTLTLRGVIIACDGTGAAEEAIESTDLLVEELMPVLYDEFTALQQAGVILPDLDEDDFYDMVYPDSEFFVNPDGTLSFFFQPEILTSPSFDVPVFTWTPAQLEALMNGEAPAEE